MELILNVSKSGYKPFLNTKIDAFIIAVNDYSEGELYKLSLDKLEDAIKEIKAANKQIYLKMNILLSETKLDDFRKDLDKYTSLEVDAFVVSDFGVLNIFKERNLLERVIFNPETYICNNLSAKFISDLGVKRISLANELELSEIIEIGNYVPGKVEVMVEGLPKISTSKRNILSTYFNYYKLNKESDIYYAREENRDSKLPMFEDEEGLYVYNNVNTSRFNDLSKLLENNIKYLRIEGFNKSEVEILELINKYKGGAAHE